MSENRPEGEKKKRKLFCPFSYSVPEGHYLLECDGGCAWYDEEYGRCIFVSRMIRLVSALEALNLRLEVAGIGADEPADEIEKKARERRKERIEKREAEKKEEEKKTTEPYWGYYIVEGTADWILNSSSGKYEVQALFEEDGEPQKWIAEHKNKIMVLSLDSVEVQEKLREFGIDAEISHRSCGDIEYNDEVLVITYSLVDGFDYMLFKKVDEYD